MKIELTTCDVCNPEGLLVAGQSSYAEMPPAANFHCSHFHGRRKRSVRYDIENTVGLCFSCHQLFGENPAEHYNFMLNRLGKKRFDLLMIRANTPKKPDLEVIRIWLEAEKMAAESKIIGSKVS